MRFVFKNVFAIVLLQGVLLTYNQLWSQLTVDSSVNAADGVQNILMGGGVEASNITFGGNEETQIGSFQCNGCGIGLASGLVLASGNVLGAEGPNSDGGFDLGPPNLQDETTDPDLFTLANSGTQTVDDLNNTAVLEFDFVPTGDEIAFNFVFGSDEYIEWVDFQYNDVFGFFLSGPGISGPYLNNATNIALIPNTNNPVSINSVNHNLNSSYFINNTDGLYNVQPDGFTTVLTAQADVICGQTYHIKIAIADAGDAAFDSWVFLEEGSFASAPLELGFAQPEIAPGVENGMYENCGAAPLTFFRPPCTSGDYTFDITYSGSVTNSVDISTLPASITIPDGEDEFVLFLDPLNDGEDEGVENLIFFTQLTLADGEVVDIEFELLIYDHPVMTVAITADDNNVCPDAPVNLLATPQNTIAGENYLWTTGATISGITVSSAVTASYEVTLTDGCGYTATATHTVDVLPYLGELHVPDSGFHLCTGAPREIMISGGVQPYSFIFDDGILDLVDGQFLSSHLILGNAEMTVTDFCGNSDNFTIEISTCDTRIPNVFTPNSDEKNASFKIEGIESFPGSTLMVFNRWGKLIFESSDYRNEWSAKEESDGNYYYIFKRSDGKEYSGYVMVVR